MDSTPLVNIIVPFYHNSEWLKQAIDSILNQSYKNYEILVINDGSPEDISDFLKKYKDVISYYYKENGGPATARNYGIELATGKYIAFLDSDDLWHPKKLETQVAFMEKNNLIWSHTSYSTFHDKNPEIVLKDIDLSYFQGNVFPRIFATSPIATPCIMILSQYLKDNKHLRFNPKMRYGQDWYLWINLAFMEQLSLIPESLTKVRIRGSNAALRARVQIVARAQIWKSINQLPSTIFSYKKRNPILVIAYHLCLFFSRIITSLEKGVLGKTRTYIELISKILYLTPYLLYKLYDKIYFKK